MQLTLVRVQVQVHTQVVVVSLRGTTADTRSTCTRSASTTLIRTCLCFPAFLLLCCSGSCKGGYAGGAASATMFCEQPPAAVNPSHKYEYEYEYLVLVLACTGTSENVQDDRWRLLLKHANVYSSMPC